MFLSEDTPYLQLVISYTVAISILHAFLDLRQLKVRDARLVPGMPRGPPPPAALLGGQCREGGAPRRAATAAQPLSHPLTRPSSSPSAQALQRPSPPPEVKKLYPAKEFRKKQAYQLAKLRFGMVHSSWDTALTVVFLRYGYYARTWAVAGDAAASVLGGSRAGEVAQSVAWALVLSVVSTALSLPWSVYRTFYLEAAHGFNKTTKLTFCTDILKSVRACWRLVSGARYYNVP